MRLVLFDNIVPNLIAYYHAQPPPDSLEAERAITDAEIQAYLAKKRRATVVSKVKHHF